MIKDKINFIKDKNCPKDKIFIVPESHVKKIGPDKYVIQVPKEDELDLFGVIVA